VSKLPTAREIEVLKLVASGRTNPEIAQQLRISVRTVEGHRSRGMFKLGISNMSELVRYAVRERLIEL
jgi:DNA-binding CsgD family transcriptional regulator